MEHEHLDRFLEAQVSVYSTALKEIMSGRKQTHWMWYIFPQIKGLATSERSRHFAIQDIHEATAYLHHAVLGERLIEVSKVLLTIHHHTATQIFGFPDDMKLKSSMTLFAQVQGAPAVFQQVLEKYFDGEHDKSTLDILLL